MILELKSSRPYSNLFSMNLMSAMDYGGPKDSKVTSMTLLFCKNSSLSAGNVLN